jgi:hypothetical protein
MSIWLEEEIRRAVLAVRWKRAGDGPHPDYFVGAPPESLRLETSAASFLAHVILDRITTGREKHQRELVKEGLDRYSLEVIASYLEDQGYTVSLPEGSKDA